MYERKITPEQIIADIFHRWPGTIPVFIQHRLACVGCQIARYDTLGDVIRNYNLDEASLLDELNRVVQNGNRPER